MEQPKTLASTIASFIEEHPVAEVSAARLEECAGIYEKALFDFDAEFQVRDGRLMLHFPTERDLPLYAASDSTFYILAWGGYRFEFSRAAEGRTGGVDVIQETARVHATRKDAARH